MKGFGLFEFTVQYLHGRADSTKLRSGQSDSEQPPPQENEPRT
jgi:hypothetical protein